jgi:hypothetical protein
MSIRGIAPIGSLAKDRTRKDAPKLRKPVRRISAKRAAHRNSDAGKAGLDHMARVAALPCVICWEWDMRQNSPTEVHHVKSGRYGSAREVDDKTIPLCHSHHNKLRPYPGDDAKIGYHNGQATWEAAYGPDHHWLAWVEARLAVTP